METISYIEGQCNNLNGKTEDFIYYWKWLFFWINYLFIRFILIFDYFINNNLLDDLYFILYKVLKIMLLGPLFLKYFSM